MVEVGGGKSQEGQGRKRRRKRGDDLVRWPGLIASTGGGDGNTTRVLAWLKTIS